MIQSDSFQKAWLDTHRSRKGYEKINPPLVEKMIHALSLVEQLAVQGLDFVFKGGTSLILLLDDAGRFSIDIDIITQAGREEIERILAAICTRLPFGKFELSEHRSYKEGVPKAHYALYYTSAWSGKEDHILLEILFEEHSYPAVLKLPVKTFWLVTHQDDILVNVPSAASIAGDKLAAFAPTTTGILYGKGKEVEIIKQLHDINKLYHRIESVEVFTKAFNDTVEKEIRYRGNQCGRNDVVDDIMNAAVLIARRERNTEEPYKGYFAEMKLGLLQFKTYLTNGTFRIEEAIVGGAKAALLAAKIRSGNVEGLPQFEPGMKKSDFLVRQPEFIDLNKLQAEPLFYWYHALNLLV
jgi:hypothetical protein